MTTALSDAGLQFADTSVISSLLRNYLAGLTLSTAGSSATMTIAPGQASDSTNLILMNLLTAIAKTTAAWALGSTVGGLDTGTIRNTAVGATCSYATTVMTCTVIPTSGTFAVGQEIQAVGVAPGTTIASLGTGTGGLGTYNLSTTPGTIAAETTAGLSWYYWYLIRRPDTGVIDVVFSLSSVSPTLPTSYTQFRYIGAAITNGSSQWTGFIQVGDEFYWATPISEFNGNSATTAVLLRVTVPSGKKVKLSGSVYYASGASGSQVIYLSDPDVNDIAPGSGTAFSISYSGAASGSAGASFKCWTNASGQIRKREFIAGIQTILLNLGWADPRGKNN